MTAATSPNGVAPALSLPELDLGDDLFSEIEQLVPRIVERLEELDRMREELLEAHRLQLAQIAERRRKYEGLLKGLDSSPPKQRRRRPERKVSPRVLFGVTNTILAHKEEDFTVLDIHEQLAGRHPDWNWSDPQSYTAFSQLREVEFIRRVAVRGDSDRHLYRIMDRSVGERLLVELQEAIDRRQKRGARAAPARQQQVLDAIVKISAREGRPATVAQIAEEIGTKTKSNIRDALALLEETNQIVKGERRREGTFGQPSMTFAPVETAHA